MENFFSWQKIKRTARNIYRTRDETTPTCSTTSNASTAQAPTLDDRLHQPHGVRNE